MPPINKSQATALAQRIQRFLDAHGKKDAEGVEWNGPDPYELESAARQLGQGSKPDRTPFSEWGSGCYQPYTDKSAQKEHDDIIQTIRKLCT